MKETSKREILNRLFTIRERRGISAAALAKAVGVSRQTIYAIEKGTYVPNTAVGLRLAQALQVGVEDLFSLPESEPLEGRVMNVTLLPSFEDSHPGQPVHVCDVAGRLVAAPSAPPSWYIPATDGVIEGKPARQNKTRVRLHEPNADLSNRLLLAGCDPAMAVAARYLQAAGVELVLLHQNSSQALSLLKRGYVHIAGTHLHDEATGQSNVSAIHRLFPSDSVAAISFAVWEEGLVIAHGNPKNIQGVQDLAKRDVTMLNREAGAGSRLLLDSHLKRLNLDSKLIRGYDRTAPGHLAAAWQVETGAADCCFATQAAARIFGLPFIPLETSRYDLVVQKTDLSLPPIQALFNTINRLKFRVELSSVCGYNTSTTGGRVL